MWVSRFRTVSAPSNARRSDATSNTSAATAPGPEALEPLAAARRARDPGDAMARGEQLMDRTPPDRAGGSGDDGVVHVQPTTYPAGS
jgi:hypothetical protein